MISNSENIKPKAILATHPLDLSRSFPAIWARRPARPLLKGRGDAGGDNGGQTGVKALHVWCDFLKYSGFVLDVEKRVETSHGEDFADGVVHVDNGDVATFGSACFSQSEKGTKSRTGNIFESLTVENDFFVGVVDKGLDFCCKLGCFGTVEPTFDDTGENAVFFFDVYFHDVMIY